MNNKEAISILYHLKKCLNDKMFFEALDMAIEALKDKGYNAGYQEGYETGLLQGSQTILNAMKNSVQIVPDQLQEWRMEADDET